jgi:tetratricopeptide (TPR) repeat protein
MKNRITAAMLSLCLGVFGVQFFYTHRTGLGIFMVMLTTVMKVPQLAVFIGLIGCIQFLTMSDEEFDKKYNFNKWRKREEERRAAEDIRRREQESYDRDRRTQELNRSSSRENRDARDRMKPVVQYPKKEKQSSTVQKEALKQSGLKKYKEYDYAGAIEDFGKALAADPKDVAVHWNLTCLYSLTEQKELGFYHLQKAVELGFVDFDKVKTHEALAYLRVQPEFDTFSRSGFKMSEDMEHSDILQQLKDLSLRREKGLLTEKEFADMSKRLME